MLKWIFILSSKNLHKGNRIRFCQSIAEGMGYLYQQNPPISHHALNSKNILVFSNNDQAQLVITDFGIPQPIDDSNNLHNLEYIAPERIPLKNEQITKPFDEKSDVYSFGIVMWELLWWKTFDEEIKNMDRLDFINKIKDGWRPSLESPNIGSTNTNSTKFINLIKRCWEVDSTIRPNFQKVLTDLFKMDVLCNADLEDSF